MSIWKNKKFVSLVMLHSVFAAVSIFLALASKVYADQFVGPAIPDLILDHIPRIDTSFFFYQGAFALVAVILVAVYCLPQYIPFILASVALFYLIRSCLMVTTHLPAAYAPSGNDLFFSGHTGPPFLSFVERVRPKDVPRGVVSGEQHARDVQQSLAPNSRDDENRVFGAGGAVCVFWTDDKEVSYDDFGSLARACFR
jgi:hypothetical protein